MYVAPAMGQSFDVLFPLFSGLVLLASSLCIAAAIRRRQTQFGWRAPAELAAWVIGSSSAILFVSTAIYAQVIGGFQYYDPDLLRIYRYGCLSALLGIALGLAGRGRVRLAVTALSGTMLILWLVLATSE